MSMTKKDLLDYYSRNPHLKKNKYMIEDYTIHYIDRKSTDVITQKLVMKGLFSYFKSKGYPDPNKEVMTVMTLIKDQRQSKIVPSIDIRNKRGDEGEDA
jgi:hypothetical protein